MTTVDDGFGSYYAERLWISLPGIVRSDDSEAAVALTGGTSSTGPLRELINRVGEQIAVVRRNIDQLWADQSIETCEEWVIPYIGNLLGTNLVNSLDVRGQRLDVAKTIHYRRRKGTLQVLEELAGDITGWDAHVAEGFRRLARTRHGLDPAVGPAGLNALAQSDVTSFLQSEGVVGVTTGTPAGGTLDLRNAHGATLVGTAFDESFHTADLRAGQGAVGLYGIPKLLVFVWRLASFPVVGATPVAVANCDNGTFTFDPTGRQIPLFLPPVSAASSDVGDTGTIDTWTSALEWEVAGPLSTSLLKVLEAQAASSQGLSGSSAASEVLNGLNAGSGSIISVSQLAPSAAVPPGPYSLTAIPLSGVFPEVGMFTTTTDVSAPSGTSPQSTVCVDYQYGFSSNGDTSIGAGTYDRSLLGNPPSQVGPVLTVSAAGPASAELYTQLSTALGAIPSVAASANSEGSGSAATATPAAALTGTVEIADSATHPDVVTVGTSTVPIGDVLIQAGYTQRPVIRLTATSSPWIFVGNENANLVLDGLFVSGADVILRGAFASVRITGCTFDPGSSGPATANSAGLPLQSAADGAVLSPTRIFIEADPTSPQGSTGAIALLSIDNSILGPIRTRFGGTVENLSITSSIVQAIPTTTGTSYTDADIYDPVLLAKGLKADNPISAAIWTGIGAAAQTALDSFEAETLQLQEGSLPAAILDGLNNAVGDSGLVTATNLSNFATLPMGQDESALFETLSEQLSSGQSSLSAADAATLNRALIDAAFPVALGLSAISAADADVTLGAVTVIGPISVHQLQASDSVIFGLAVVEDTQDGCFRFSSTFANSQVPRQYQVAFISEGASLFTSDDFGQPGYGQLLESVDSAIQLSSQSSTISTGAENGSQMGAFSQNMDPVKEQALLIKFTEYMPLGLTPVIIHVT